MVFVLQIAVGVPNFHQKLTFGERFVVEHFRYAETYQNACGSYCLSKAIKRSLAVCCLRTEHKTLPDSKIIILVKVFAELFSKSDRVPRVPL